MSLGYHKFNFNQPSGTSGVEITQLLETAKGCVSNPVGTFFFANLSFCAFSGYRPSVYFVGLAFVAELFLKVQLSSKLL